MSVTRRKFATGALAATVAGLVTACAALAPEPARADPPPAPIDTSVLLQGEDFRGFDGGDRLDTDLVHRYGGQALSACSGEMRMATITAGGPKQEYPDVAAQWTSERDAGGLLTESVSDGYDAKTTDTFVKRLTKAVEACEKEPSGHWYSSKAHALNSSGGSATWYVAYDGKGHPTGGVSVIRKGTRFGIVEVSNLPFDATAFQRYISGAAIDRLGG